MRRMVNRAEGTEQFERFHNPRDGLGNWLLSKQELLKNVIRKALLARGARPTDDRVCDVLQESILIALSRVRDVEDKRKAPPEKGWAPWTIGVVKRCAQRDDLRRLKEFQEQELLELLEDPKREKDDTRAIVTSYLRTLKSGSARKVAVTYLRPFLEKDDSEYPSERRIAAKLGCTRRTVHGWLERIKNDLRTLLS